MPSGEDYNKPINTRWLLPVMEGVCVDDPYSKAPQYREITLGEKLDQLDQKFNTLMQRILRLEERLGMMESNIRRLGVEASTHNNVLTSHDTQLMHLATRNEEVKTLQSFMLDIQEQIDEVWEELREEK